MGRDAPGAALTGLGAGSKVAGYRLEERLGAGGMAVVHRARDARLDRVVALKLLAPALAADETFRRRFIRESLAGAAVDHPHIIPVYEAGEADGVLFIAMRLVEDGDLRGVAAREGAMPGERMADFVSPIASALDAAHAAGLIHRDVKPANILVDAAHGGPDHVYLSDFGLSKRAMSGMSITGSGQFLGTPDYCAPEQASGLAVTGQADQYALGCVAFHLLTGEPPFVRDQPTATLLAHLSQPAPEVTRQRPDLPHAVDQVLARALAKAPQDRYASCHDFAEALREALGLAPYSAAGVPDHPPTQIVRWPEPRVGFSVVPPGAAAASTVTRLGAPARRSRLPRAASAAVRTPVRGVPVGRTAVAGLLLAGLAAIVLILGDKAFYAVFSGGSAGAARGARIVATLPDPDDYPVNAAVFSPGGQILATGGAESSSAYLFRPGTGHLIATLADPIGDIITSAAFSPDGRTLAAGGDGGASLWDVATRGHTLLTIPRGAVTSVAFSPGGRILAGGDSYGRTYLWDVSARTRIVTLTDPGRRISVSSVEFGPGGRILATTDANGHTYLWDAATGHLIAALADPGSRGVYSAAFSPGGRILATTDANGHTYLWDTATRDLTATLTDPVGGFVTWAAFSPGGQVLATSDAKRAGDDHGRTYLWDPASGHLIATLADPGSQGIVGCSFSPDGKTLAVADGNGSTYIWNVAPAVARRS